MGIRRTRYNWFVVFLVFTLVFGVTFLVQKNNDRDVEAANLGAFDPGYIISDYQISNYTSMTEAQIQNFLKSKNGCNDYNTGKTSNNVGHLSESTPYSWHVKDGHYVCMADENFNGESAAHIIWQAAQDYRINPQVLIVLLQKEQGLITDTFPNSVQYRSATGFGCPDTAACSSKYYGFKNQVRNAADLFRTVLDGGWTNYPVGNNYVKYNPNAACGGTVVNIRNRATSALYRYTPYQPNSSALASGYGTGDSCGAYGNRNFYLYFEDWFGGITSGVYEEYIEEAVTKYEKPITDGVYRLYSKSYLNEVLDVKGGVSLTKTTGSLQMYSRKTSNNENQVFEIKYDENDGFYNIINPTTGSAFDVKSAGTLNATPVNIYPLHSNCNQDWLFERDDDGYYKIISRCSSKVLDISLSRNVVQIFSDHGGDNQKWQLIKIENDHNVVDGVYQFYSKSYLNEVLDVKGGVSLTKTTGSLQMYSRKTSNNENQVFEIKYDENDGFYNIINPTTGSAFDVKSAGTLNATPVNIYPLHSNCNQDWLFERDDDGYYKIISRCSSKVLDISLSRNVVQIFSDHGGDNQKWQLIKK